MLRWGKLLEMKWHPGYCTTHTRTEEKVTFIHTTSNYREVRINVLIVPRFLLYWNSLWNEWEYCVTLHGWYSNITCMDSGMHAFIPSFTGPCKLDRAWGIMWFQIPGMKFAVCSCSSQVALFPGRSHLQLMIACSMQKWMGKAWEKELCAWTSGIDVRGGGGGGWVVI